MQERGGRSDTEVATRRGSRRKHTSSGPGTTSFPAGTELSDRLLEKARVLQVVYATCVTVEAALLYQDAECDVEIARCLRIHVTEVVARQAEELLRLARRLGAAQPDTITNRPAGTPIAEAGAAE